MSFELDIVKKRFIVIVCIELMFSIWFDIMSIKVVYFVDIIEIKFRKYWVDEIY